MSETPVYQLISFMKKLSCFVGHLSERVNLPCWFYFIFLYIYHSRKKGVGPSFKNKNNNNNKTWQFFPLWCLHNWKWYWIGLIRWQWLEARSFRSGVIDSSLISSYFGSQVYIYISLRGYCTPDQFVTICAFFSKITTHWWQRRYVSCR